MKRLFVLLMCSAILAIGSTITAGQDSAKEQKLKISQLPPAVVEAIKTNCSGCSIDKAAREVENGVTIYDIEFKRGQGEIALTEDGSVVDRETAVLLKDVPAAALDAIRKGASGAKIKQIAKGEIRAELKDGQIIKLASPRYVYEAELEKGGQVAEIEGLAWGPDLEDGRHVLYVFSDNDLNPGLASQIYSFAIDPALINLEQQFLPGPLYPPGQVKKAIQSNH